MASLVLGTAGHIDHGKSSLVKALTGTDPDRLPEEQKRGVTIELGFAQLKLPSGRTFGVVDVPGHEKFVRQMVAGATGIDVALLVVAADDGVMPQTREHLAIIDLLGIPRGVVAITKSDLVDADWVELVKEDVEKLLVGTSIEGAPIVAVSSRTRQGLDDLTRVLDDLAEEAPSRQASLPMRLPVDRVFTIAGAGTVVTGTLWSGQVKPGEQIEVYPTHREARVRSIQVHSEQVDKAVAGQRVAMNLAGLDKDEIARGEIVAAPGSLTVTDRFDALFTFLGGPDGKPFVSGTRVHVHHGTREVLGRVLLMDAEEFRPGERGYAQIRLEETLAPRYDDRFIVRSYSPVYTIGGGTVLDVMPPRRTRIKPAERDLLDALVHRDVAAATMGLLVSRAFPMTSAEVAGLLGIPRSDVADALNKAKGMERLKAAGETYFVTSEALQAHVGQIEAALNAFHDANPKATGIATLALRDQVDRRIPPKVFDALLEVAETRGVAASEGGLVRNPKSASAALAQEQTAMESLQSLLDSQGLAPQAPYELAARIGIETGLASRALNKLAQKGTAIRLTGDMYFSVAAVEEAKDKIVAYLREHGTMLAKDARDITGSSRKYIVPLLEYFDATGVTKRDGDVRVLRNP